MGNHIAMQEGLLIKEKYRGYCAIRQSYFFEIKVHMLVTKLGEPVEFLIEPAALSDIRVARTFNFNIPRGSIIHADRAYTDYSLEFLYASKLH